MKLYQPINCSFYDLLEAAATQRRVVQMVVRHSDQSTETYQTLVTNLYTHDGEEFMVQANGLHLRLDCLLRFDDFSIEDFPSCALPFS